MDDEQKVISMAHAEHSSGELKMPVPAAHQPPVSFEHKSSKQEHP